MSPKAVLRPLILASTSPYRAALLDDLACPSTAANPGVDEAEVPANRRGQRAVRLAEAKAEAVARQFPEAVVIGSDQVAAARRHDPSQAGNRGKLPRAAEIALGLYRRVLHCLHGAMHGRPA